MSSEAKSINLLLYDGSFDGVICIQDSRWNSGELFAAPRESVSGLLDQGACKSSGVYLLLSDEKVYVGQSSDLSRRLTQHLDKKDWWDNVVVLTTTDDSLDHADIDYLESCLIERARKVGSLDCDNMNGGNLRKVDRFREVVLEQYLKEALFLIELIGIDALSPGRRDGFGGESEDIMRLRLGTKAKAQAIAHLESQGIELAASKSYSKLADDGKHYWINPQTSVLADDWSIVLNDTARYELVVLFVPAGSLSMATSDTGGLSARSDKPHLIDLHIDAQTFVDRTSGVDFSPYVTRRVSY